MLLLWRTIEGSEHQPRGVAGRQASWLVFVWVVVPLCCLLGITILVPHEADLQQNAAAQSEPALSPPLRVIATGREFEWWFRYPGADLVVGTEDDVEERRRLLIPVDVDVVVDITSDDYVYTFTVDEAGVREIGVPEIWNSVKLHLSETGEFDLPVDPLCSFRPLHDTTMGRVETAGAPEIRRLFGSAAILKQVRRPTK